MSYPLTGFQDPDPSPIDHPGVFGPGVHDLYPLLIATLPTLEPINRTLSQFLQTGRKYKQRHEEGIESFQLIKNCEVDDSNFATSLLFNQVARIF